MDSAGGVDSAGGLTSAGISVAVGPTVPAEPSSPLRDPSKGKAVATPSSPVTPPTDKELADQQAAILEAERQELLEQELKQNINAKQVYLDSLQAKLDSVALNLTNEEWIGLVDQVRANLTLPAELLGADVSEDTFSNCRKLHLFLLVQPLLLVIPFLLLHLFLLVFSIFAASFIHAATPITAGVSTTADASGSASEASVPIIELLDSPPKDT
nr:hypothetical protein [Tanacetum cinerariifolium]